MDMRLTSAAMLVVILLLDATNDSRAQETRITLDDVARAMGGASLKSIEYTGAGASFAVGQSTAPGQPWPRFDVKSYVRSVNYETASLREDAVRQRTDASPRGGGVPAMGEARQIFAVSGEHTWNVAGETITPAPVALAERQFQLWSTPHGVVKAAMAHGGSSHMRSPGAPSSRRPSMPETWWSGSRRSSRIPCSVTFPSRSPTRTTA